MQGVRAVGIFGLQSSSRGLFDAIHAEEKRSAMSKRAGCVIRRTRLSNAREMTRGVLVGGSDVLLELLDVHPQLPGESPLTVRATSQGWKFSPRMKAVTALGLIVGCSGRDAMQFSLHSGRIEGGTKFAAQGISGLQIQRAGRCKSRAFMTFVREAGAGAEVVSAAFAQTQ